MGCVIKQFSLDLSRSNQNKRWVTIPTDVRSKIKNIAEKVKGVTIPAIMPCVVAKQSVHLLSVHGNNTKALVMNISRDMLFALGGGYVML